MEIDEFKESFKMNTHFFIDETNAVNIEFNDFINAHKADINKLIPTKDSLYLIKSKCIMNGFYMKASGVYCNNQLYLDRLYHAEGDIYNNKFCKLKSNHWIPIWNLCKQDGLKIKKSNTKVYVMIDHNTGFYKIGRSKNPLRRERTLQSEKPTVDLLFYDDGSMADEKHLHKSYMNKRVRGEWFDLDINDLRNIGNYFKKQNAK